MLQKIKVDWQLQPCTPLAGFILFHISSETGSGIPDLAPLSKLTSNALALKGSGSYKQLVTLPSLLLVCLDFLARFTVLQPPPGRTLGLVKATVLKEEVTPLQTPSHFLHPAYFTGHLTSSRVAGNLLGGSWGRVQGTVDFCKLTGGSFAHLPSPRCS